MDLRYTAEDETFRAEVRAWLSEQMAGKWGLLKGTGGEGREHEFFEERRDWERLLGESGWTGIGWPKEYGGRDLPLIQQVIFHEEYARAQAPRRVNHIGEQLLGPTLIAHGSAEQKAQFLPGILSGEDLWCQGYSEPDAGSDLANVRTTAVRDGDEWVINGQKVWTSLAHLSQWCFVVVRTDPDAAKHKGLSYVLVPMDQPGVEVRPIIQMTGTSEFNEVYFTNARCTEMVGEPGDGWKVAMATLGFERGVSTLAQQIGFARELDHVIEAARVTGAIKDPLIQDRIVQLWGGLKVIRITALKNLSQKVPGNEASIAKLLWASWHRDLGELAMDILGESATVADEAPYELNPLQRLYLFARSDTIYGGSNEIQRNIIAERMLGLPRD